MIDYTPLWDTMREKNITTYMLINTYHVDAHTISRLKQNKSVTINTLETLCKILDCTADKVVRFV